MPNCEVVVVLRAEGAAAREFSVEAPTATAAGRDLAQVLQSFNATMRPMFEIAAVPEGPELRTMARTEVEAAVAAQMSRYYSVDVHDADADRLAEELKRSNIVETVYVKPATELPIAPSSEIARGSPAQRFPIVAALNGRMRRAQFETAVSAPAPASSPSIPDFRSRQAYLDVAPAGVDAAFAWSMVGGKGGNVRIIDIEGDWRFSHVDLRANVGGLIGGTSYNDVEWRNHGTAVLGEIGGDENTFGIVGIAPDARVQLCVSSRHRLSPRHPPSGRASGPRRRPASGDAPSGATLQFC